MVEDASIGVLATAWLLFFLLWAISAIIKLKGGKRSERNRRSGPGRAAQSVAVYRSARNRLRDLGKKAVLGSGRIGGST